MNSKVSRFFPRSPGMARGSLATLFALGVALCAVNVSQAETHTPYAPPLDATSTAYRHATLIDVTAGKALTGMTVVVTGERIAAVETDDAFDASKTQVTQDDLHGAFVMPGLIDSHVHLATPPDRVEAEMILRRDIYGGVTTVRDMADDLRAVGDLARATRVGEIPGPDIRYAALMAGPSFFTDPRTWAVAHGATPGNVPWMQAVTPQTDLALAVAMARGTSATAIKIYANLPGEEVVRITAEAHRQHLAVWAHSAVFPATPQQVIDAGVDVVSHVCYMAYQASDKVPDSYQQRVPVEAARLSDGDNPVMQSLFSQLKARNIILDATLRVYLEDDRRALLQKTGKPQLCTSDTAGILIHQAWSAGVAISTGTDGVAKPDVAWPEVHDELFALVERAHLPVAEVLKAATLTGAMASSQSDEAGLIAPGRLANMIVLARNPLDDIHNIRSLTLTLKRGHPYPRADFHPASGPEQ